MDNIIDLLLVDDDQGIHEVVEFIASEAGLNVKYFYSGLEALDYLKNLEPEKFPTAYLIDMRIPGSTEELASSMSIFKFLEEVKADISLFRFFTGSISDHDKMVISETGAQAMLKEREDFDPFIEEIKKAVGK
ncbi:MAG: hypothetical protein OEX08_00110 [Candidatus Nomurabacteria bacterium]|nr:hypothetical protein [Candidatus Nomurabacteria bacterium]